MHNNEKSKLIRKWSEIKISLDLSEKYAQSFKEGDVWWASIGMNIGHEEDGKHQKFERPILILKKFNQHLLLIVPLSSKLKENNKYYHKIMVSSKFSSVMMFQVRTVSSKRLIRKMGRINTGDFAELRRIIRNFI